MDPAFTGLAPGSVATYNQYANQTPVAGVVIGQNGFATINAALTAAAANNEADTLNLAATTLVLDNTVPAPTASNPNATAPVTVNVTGDTVSLVGSGGVTVINPKGPTQNGLTAVLQANGTSGGTPTVLNLSNLTFDGKAGTLNVGRAVSYVSGAAGTINNVTIQNVAFPASFDGYAVSALTGSNVAVTNSTLLGYGRAGVTVSNSTAVIQGNTILGLGNANKFNYGIQVANNSNSPGGTASVNISGNTIGNNIGGQVDSAGNFQVSAGVLVFTTTNTTPVVQAFGNNINANQAGALVASSADSGVNASPVLFYANNFTNNLSPAIAAPTATAGAAQAPANYYAGNAPAQNGTNGVTDNVATAGTFLTTPAPVIAAPSPTAYQQAASQATALPPPDIIQTTGTFSVGAGGGAPQVYTYGRDGTKLATVETGLPSTFTGGVRVAMADVNNDGVADTVVATGPGVKAEVKVISGKDNKTLLADLFPFGDFTGGAFVTAADLSNDGFAEVLVTPDQSGGPRVVLYDGSTLKPGATPKVVANFIGLADVQGNIDANFRGGARPALADVTGDGVPDLILSAGFTGGPRINIWNGASMIAANGGAPTSNPIANFFAFESSLRNGAFVAGVDLNKDGKADPVFGGGPGGGPRVRVADATAILKAGGAFNIESPGAVISNFFAGNSDLRGGIRVLGRDLDGDGFGDIITGSGDATVSDVRIYPGANVLKAPSNPEFSVDVNPFGSALANGVWVG